jgi:hypothetical protein
MITQTKRAWIRLSDHAAQLGQELKHADNAGVSMADPNYMRRLFKLANLCAAMKRLERKMPGGYRYAP